MKAKWRDSEEKPQKKRYFDLCLLDIGRKQVYGWWTGSMWTGMKYRGEPVKRWKFVKVHYGKHVYE